MHYLDLKSASFVEAMHRGPGAGQYRGSGAAPDPWHFLLTGSDAEYDLAVAIDESDTYAWPCL
jgi:hypothetical protein